jgi:hypothetical protein
MGEQLIRGNSNVDDAVVGVTTTSLKNAIGALNTSTGDAVFPGGNAIFGVTTAVNGCGVFGANNSAKGVGIQGNGPDAGISGFSETGDGLRAHSNHGNGTSTFAHDPNGNALLGINDSKVASTATDGSPHGSGVLGVTTVPGAAGVFGANNSGQGVGVQGNGPEAGVRGFSKAGIGVEALSNSGTALHVQGGGLAARFSGNVEMIGNLDLIGPSSLSLQQGDVLFGNSVGDCAEDFSVASTVQAKPGAVMVLGSQGELRESATPYDKRVAGVVSGAGGYRPGLILDRQPDKAGRATIALMGKVYCKVDAQYGAVSVGDLLTTSATVGHAMKAADAGRAFGAVIGKALGTLSDGQGLVPILVALQ